jgi:hypothetical protein
MEIHDRKGKSERTKTQEVTPRVEERLTDGFCSYQFLSVHCEWNPVTHTH